MKENGGRDAAPGVSAEFARRLLAMRRLRDRLLGSYFSEPAWDILLDLYVQTHEGRTVTVSQLSLATGAPPTTALRWINTLAGEGLLVRRTDEADARRVLVNLTAAGEEAMRLLLATAVSEFTAALGESTRRGRKQGAAKSLRTRCETSPSSSTPSSTHDPETAS